MALTKVEIERRRCTHMFNEMVVILKLEWCDFTLRFDEDGNNNSIAQIRTQYEYREAFITFNVTACMVLEDAELRKVIIHELCHVLMGPIHKKLKGGSVEKEELATQNIQRAILAALDA
jgi:hypothetical protein